ncbi:MAG: tetratricopeptide repeat protein, partial [Myxococcota bacterium]
DEAQALQFVHDRLRETAYVEADPERLAAIHRRAAEVLEAQETFEPATTALHWVCGGEPQQGRARYVEAAQRDAKRWAVRDALRHLRAALDLQVGDGDADLELQAQQFQWTSLLGDHRETVQLAEQLLERLQGTLSEAQLRLKGQAHLNAATSLEQLTQLEQSQHHIEAAAVVLEQLGEDKRLEGHIAMAQGSLMKAMDGEHEAIVALFQRAAQCYKEAGDARLQGRSLALLSEQWLLYGRFDVSSSICREALELSRSVQDLHGEALLLRRLGQNASMTSKFAEAEAYLSQSLELHRKTGNGDGEAAVHVLLGQLHAGVNPEGALERFLRALELRQRYGTRHWKILSFIANICTELGRMREARMWVRRARQQAKRERSEGSAALLVMEAYVNLNLGDMKELGRIAAILRARVDQDPEAHIDAAGWLLFYEGMLHKAHGELDKALASLQAHGDAVKHQGRMEAFYFAQIEQIQVHILKGSLDDAEALLDALPASFLEDGYAEANMLLNRATLRRHQGQLHEAYTHAEAAQEAFQSMNETVMLVGAVCERAMIAYGLGEPLDPILDELLPLTQELEIFSDGDTGQCLLELQALVPEVELIRFLKHPETDRPDEH